jgi:hypothetical protein
MKTVYKQAVESVDHQREIRFKLDGLRHDLHEEDVFVLPVPGIDVNYQGVFEALGEVGLEPRLIDDAVELMAEFIFSRQLAQHFAKNLKRVG